MGSIEERIKEIEEEIRITPKNKGTEAHLAKLKAKLAALKEMQQKRSKSSSSGTYYAVKKQGNATVSMIGFPSVGKSSLLNALTNAESEIADYAFTTLTLVPGMMFYEGYEIQIFDLPGIIEGASEGKGRGKEVLAAARSSDLILIVLDATKNPEEQYEIIKEELYSLGFRINKKKPEIKIIKKDRGGLQVFVPKHLSINPEDIKELARDFNIHNAEIIVSYAESLQDVVDAFASNRVYVKGLVVINKIDAVSEKDLSSLRSKFPDGVFISVNKNINLDELRRRIIQELGLIKIYTKKPGQEPDRDEPLIMRSPCKVEDVAGKLRLLKDFDYAKVWGSSVKFQGQRVGLEHELKDGDVIEIHVKK